MCCQCWGKGRLAGREEIEQLRTVVSRLHGRCRDCCSYSPGCGSDYDGICKHCGMPPTTELGREKGIWRHVYEIDSCAAFDEERPRRIAEAARKESE